MQAGPSRPKLAYEAFFFLFFFCFLFIFLLIHLNSNLVFFGIFEFKAGVSHPLDFQMCGPQHFYLYILGTLFTILYTIILGLD